MFIIPCGRKLSFIRFFALHTCMVLNFGWLVTCSVTHALVYFLNLNYKPALDYVGSP